MNNANSQKLLHAFTNALNFNYANTVVSQTPDGDTLCTLHGNPIAKRTADGKLYLSHAGWITATTADRLHTLTQSLGAPARVNRKQGAMIVTIDANFTRDDDAVHLTDDRTIELTSDWTLIA